ncbi:MAG: Oxygen-insensitive NADPH nitroreductase (EC [uncultured Paraburkholderia sp.]|nr:MAG: Oxygen-insensitive NADPH nitroreductase (EC [uncultured Paraburkholderia sp.]
MLASVVRTFDLGGGLAAAHHALAEGSPLLVCLATSTDDAPAWLAAGQALERLLLVAANAGITASYLKSADRGRRAARAAAYAARDGRGSATRVARRPRETAGGPFAAPAADRARVLKDPRLSLEAAMKHFFRLGTTTPTATGARPVHGESPPRIVLDAFSKRRTTRRFAPTGLDDATLGQLLWAANGVNRRNPVAEPDGGDRRTAPSVLALHEIDVYAALARGMYRYNPRAHCLDLVIAADLRALTGYQDFVGEAPVELVYVADLARMQDIAASAASQCEPFAYASAGAIVQNVYLFCAAAGLAVTARSWLNRSTLGAEMRLSRDSVPVLAQTVGHFDPADSANLADSC